MCGTPSREPAAGAGVRRPLLWRVMAPAAMVMVFDCPAWTWGPVLEWKREAWCPPHASLIASAETQT